MSKANTTESYMPLVHISGNEVEVSVLFDSGARDVNRQSRCIRFPATFTSFELQFDGFNSINNDDPLSPCFEGKVLLSVYLPNDKSASVYTLADARYIVTNDTGTIRKGKIPDVSALALALRRDVCDAFTQALVSYLKQRQYNQDQQVMPSLPANVVALGHQTAVQDTAREASNDKRYRWVRNALLMLLAAGICFWTIQFWPGEKASSQIAQAVVPSTKSPSPSIAIDPNDVASQVELTRQTLRQMGLDVDQHVGDTGCLIGK